jgi:hypothetical protein
MPRPCDEPEALLGSFDVGVVVKVLKALSGSHPS